MTKREFVIQDLLSKIYIDKFSDGKLPNQREMAKDYGVSRYTIQEALRVIEEMGVIVLIQGSGIYINKKWKKNPMIFNSLNRAPYERIESRMLSLDKRLATREECHVFQLENEEEIWIYKRIRLVDYEIQQLETSKMPVKLFPKLSQEIIEKSVQKFVTFSGYKISHYITNYTPILINKEEAKIFGCKRGIPAMKIRNRGLLKDNQIFIVSEVTALDYSVSYIRPYYVEFHRYKNENEEISSKGIEGRG